MTMRCLLSARCVCSRRQLVPFSERISISDSYLQILILISGWKSTNWLRNLAKMEILSKKGGELPTTGLYLCKIFARWVYKNTNACNDMTMCCLFFWLLLCILVQHLQQSTESPILDARFCWPKTGFRARVNEIKSGIPCSDLQDGFTKIQTHAMTWRTEHWIPDFFVHAPQGNMQLKLITTCDSRMRWKQAITYDFHARADPEIPDLKMLMRARNAVWRQKR